MSHTAHKTDEEKKEFFDSRHELEQKVEQLAAEIRAANHFVVFTGAGISTSAGIPDFRSGVNTVLETGPGCWEKKANIEKALREGKSPMQASKVGFRVPMERSMPTKGHMALYSLMEAGILKHVISQNVDGLHRKSGIPADKLTEVHGNTNLEICMKCEKGYMRDYGTRSAKGVKDHKTGRKCDNSNCLGDLKDTIINFGENLRECDIKTGFEQGGAADLQLSIGSSLRVTPAAHMFGETLNHGGKLWIINLQKTPYTERGTQIYAKIDDVLCMLMEKLGLDIPEFKLKRYARFTLHEWNGIEHLSVSGIDEAGGPYTIFNNVTLDSHTSTTVQLTGEEEVHEAVFAFQGHYNEPDLTVEVNQSFIENQVLDIVMTYNPNQGQWESVTTKDGARSLPFHADTGTSVELKRDNAEAVPNIDIESLSLDTEQKGFAVMFKEDCPHLASALSDQLVVDVKSPCEICSNVGENWLCMTCSKVYCSRYVKGHMVEHNGVSKHPIATSFSDASVWCYSCDDYIDAPVLRNVKQAVGLAKTQE